MKKYFLSFFVFATSAIYVVYQYFIGSSLNTIIPPGSTEISRSEPTTSSTNKPKETIPTPIQKIPVKTPTQTPKRTPTPLPTHTPTPLPTYMPTPTPKPKGQYVDGTYTGIPADAYYGTVQIQAVIQNGKLATVIFLQYPNDRKNSININNQAMPLLKSEAVEAQSANVSGVSGATATSEAFIQSLGDALSQAKNI